MYKKKTNNPKMGRPKINDLNWDFIEKAIERHNTQEDLAYMMGISADTLSRRIKEKYGVTFAEFYKQKKAVGRDFVRRKMWEQLERGNVPLLIWCSKNWLGMRETIEHTGEVKGFNLAYNLKDND